MGCSPLRTAGGQGLARPLCALSDVCQVDEENRPIAACISIPLAEAQILHDKRSASFPDIVQTALAYIVSAFAVNLQTLPYILTWDPTWRKQALMYAKRGLVEGEDVPFRSYV